MKTSDNGRKLIEQFEGLILQAYDDANDRVVAINSRPKGTITIGYGHTNAAGPPAVYVGQTITSVEADGILASDLHTVEEHVSKIVTVPLNQNQFDALVSFEFNTGALAHSSALTKLNQGDYQGCTAVMGQYIHANGQVYQGLVKRRKAEIDLFNTAPKLGQAQPTPTPSTQSQPTQIATQSWLANILNFLLSFIKGK